jgi:hypothetical protein
LDWRFDGPTALVSIAAGKAADLVVLAGNRAKNIDDVERVGTWRWRTVSEQEGVVDDIQRLLGLRWRR